MNKRFYDLVRNILRPVYALMYPSKITGAENIPSEGGFILCANHCSARDPAFLSVKLRKRRYAYLAKAELFKNPLLRSILGEKGLGAIAISRGQSDIAAMRTALKVISDGGALGIFPQGTRSRDNSPTPMLNGVSLIALRARGPIIPVYLDGPYRLFRHVDIRVGPPVDISDLKAKYSSENLSIITGRIEKAIWSMREGN